MNVGPVLSTRNVGTSPAANTAAFPAASVTPVNDSVTLPSDVVGPTSNASRHTPDPALDSTAVTLVDVPLAVRNVNVGVPTSPLSANVTCAATVFAPPAGSGRGEAYEASVFGTTPPSV